MHAIELKPKNPHSRWVALDARNQIIAEGKNPEAVERKAIQLTDVYFLMYLPKKGLIYFL